MSTTAVALAGYIAWIIVLLVVLLIYRTSVVLKGEKAPNQFSASGADVSELGLRITRAQANCVESFPVVGGVFLLALATQQTQITDSLAMWALYARLAQSLVHIASTSVLAVQLRLVFFVVQVALSGYWLYQMVF